MATKKSTPKTTAKPQNTVRPTPGQAREAQKPLTQFFQSGFWSEQRMPVLVLLALAFVLYGISIGFEYLMDDQLVIWDNIFVQKGFAGLRDIFSHDSLLGYYKEEKLLLEGGRYRPLPLATFAFEVGIFGKNHPGIGHFVNILLYGASGIFIYRILLGLFPLREGGKWFFSLPFLTAVIFMLHPLHTEVVANIKSRDEILALLGALGALYATMKYFDTNRGSWLFWAGASFFLGLLSKENTLTYLAVIPVALWMFTKIPAGRISSATLPLLAASLLFVLLRFKALGYMVHHSKAMDDLVFNPFFGMGAGEKYATIFLSLGWYLKLLFVPHPLTHDYYPYHVPKIDWSDWRAGVSLAIYLAMGIWAFLQLRNARKTASDQTERLFYSSVPAFCILYYLLTISVVSNIFADTSTFLNERLAYMPSLGFCLLAGWFLAWKLPEWQGKTQDNPTAVSAGLLGIVVILFGIRVWTRLPDWGGKGEGLVESAMQISENSYRANYYYASMLYNEQYLKMADSGDVTAQTEKNNLLSNIESHVDRALEIYPGYLLASTLKANVATARYRQDKQLDKLLAQFEKLIKTQPGNGDMLIVVLDVLKSLKGSDPNVYDAFCHRIGYELYFKQKHDMNGALEFLNHGLNNYPQDVNILQDLVEVYTAMGDQAKAAEMQQRLQAK